MADGTKIEWCDATVNAINGCSLASPGCTNCYAMKQAHRFPVRQGLTMPSKGGMVWTGEVRLSESALLQPLRWKRPRIIFWNAHGDPFHPKVPVAWIDRMFMVMAATPQHIHLVLTKRTARMRQYFADLSCDDSFRPYVRRPGWQNPSPRDGDRVILLEQGQSWPLSNVWLGTSIEDRARLNERAADLKAITAAGHFWSAEPLLEDLGDIPAHLFPDGVIVGGESGHNARPMHPDWARNLRDQCAAAGVDFHFKQWGEWAPGECADHAQTRTEKVATWWSDKWDFDEITPRVGEELHVDDAPDLWRIGKKRAGRHLDGVQHDALPWRKEAA